jgi:hypothetical protein
MDSTRGGPKRKTPKDAPNVLISLDTRLSQLVARLADRNANIDSLAADGLRYRDFQSAQCARPQGQSSYRCNNHTFGFVICPNLILVSQAASEVDASMVLSSETLQQRAGNFTARSVNGI